MDSRTAEPAAALLTETWLPGSEKVVAFSTSSATRCARPSARCEATGGSTANRTATRSKCSISLTAVRTTSDSGMGARSRRPVSMPASTSSDSALRRIRVARWSSRNSSWRMSGSSSVRSS